MNWKSTVALLGLTLFLTSCAEETPPDEPEDPIVYILDPGSDPVPSTDPNNSDKK